MASSYGLELFPAPPSVAVVNRVVSSASTKAGAVYFTNREITVRYVGVCCSAVSGSPALDVRVETVSGDVPSGTLWSAGTNAAYSPTLINRFIWTQLTSDAVITAGSLFALVVGYTSGTSATVRFRCFGTGHPRGLPYPTEMSSGTWITSDGTPCICAKLSDGTILRGGALMSQFSNSVYQSGTNPNERALVFTSPLSGTLSGVRVALGMAVGAACTINVYEGSNTSPISGGTITLPADAWVGTGVSAGGPLFFDSPLSITAGTTYRVSVKSTAAANLTLSRLIFESADERNATIGEATEDTRNGGAWLGETTTVTPTISLIFDSVTAGGGSLINAGLIRA